MDDTIHQLHLQAGNICGEELTCGNKFRFGSEEAAWKAAERHNIWTERKHDCEAYPCAFCGKWHIGRIMSVDELRAIIAGEGANVQE